MKAPFLVALSLLACGALASAADAPAPAHIRELWIVHFSHTDIGFTDHPTVCRELYRRYFDIAVDAVLDSVQRPGAERFCWTAEATLPVLDWWAAAGGDRREQFLAAVRSGQLDVAALAFNNTPFMNAAQWQTMVHWLPEDLWNRVQPRVAVQNDVNGLPRAAAMALLDRGVKCLFTGINEDSGGVPFPRPAAFWWRMPDGRRMFVWLNIGYGSGFDFFEPGEWRRGPVPHAADTRYRPPRAGDILRADEASVRAAHGQCVERLRGIERGGYAADVLTISITSQWRFDNDPPFQPLAQFVAAWNRLGLTPKLRLATVTEAMERLEQAFGASAPEHAGEWTDWWANGTASAPREVAASRAAKRFLTAAASPLWGPLTESARQTADQILRELCLFDEHTWGSSLSIALPYSLDTIGQFTEKAGLAYRSMARAEWLLSQRARTHLLSRGEGFFVANPAPEAWSGWVRLIATCLRQPTGALVDTASGREYPLVFEPGIQPWGRPTKPEDLSHEDVSATFSDRAPRAVAKFWIDRLEPRTVVRLEPRAEASPGAGAARAPVPEMAVDAHGWPTSVRWSGMTKPLFLPGYGDLVAVRVKGFAPRWVLADIRGASGAERERLRRENLEENVANPRRAAEREETPHSVVFEQRMEHPRLEWGTRRLEVWRGEPRARLTWRFHRRPSAAPEIIYVVCPLPTGDRLPRVSSGGLPFVPFHDQLEGACRDYFAIDSWAEYELPEGRWLWVSRDAPLISFGAAPTLARLTQPPADAHRLLAMVLNNFWYTNFHADSPGIMEFRFDLVWQPAGAVAGPAEELAETLAAEPVVLIQPPLSEDPRVAERLYRP